MVALSELKVCIWLYHWVLPRVRGLYLYQWSLCLDLSQWFVSATETVPWSQSRFVSRPVFVPWPESRFKVLYLGLS